jgi:hypothetical protein
MTDNNREKWNKTVQERIARNKAAVCEQLRKMPILRIALERASVSRSTYYHWRDEDEQFRKDADAAIAEGEALITDMSESQLISLIRDKHFPAVQLWLRHHHPKYANKVEISGGLDVRDESLTPEEQIVVLEALKLAGVRENNEPESNEIDRKPSS